MVQETRTGLQLETGKICVSLKKREKRKILKGVKQRRIESRESIWRATRLRIVHR